MDQPVVPIERNEAGPEAQGIRQRRRQDEQLVQNPQFPPWQQVPRQVPWNDQDSNDVGSEVEPRLLINLTFSGYTIISLSKDDMLHLCGYIANGYYISLAVLGKVLHFFFECWFHRTETLTSLLPTGRTKTHESLVYALLWALGISNSRCDKACLLEIVAWLNYIQDSCWQVKGFENLCSLIRRLAELRGWERAQRLIDFFRLHPWLMVNSVSSIRLFAKLRGWRSAQRLIKIFHFPPWLMWIWEVFAGELVEDA